jgi:hypothetical protein
MKNPIKILEPNTTGRDFVFGDLHGSLTAFINLLYNLNFDPAVDRAISVGDLCDRGPDSLGCLSLLKEPWFHAALSNHEFMMLEAFNGGHSGDYWIPNGGGWGAPALVYHDALKTAAADKPGDLEPPSPETLRLFDLLNEVAELPFLITINRPDGKKFHVLHAELPPGQFVTDADLSSPEKVIDLATSYDGQNGESFLWSRFLFGQFYNTDLLNNIDKIKRSVQHKFKGSSGPFSDKLSHIISGHTILQHPLTIYGQTNIDTGAYSSYKDHAPKWAALTCVELGSWTFYQGTSTEFRTVQPITINAETL